MTADPRVTAAREFLAIVARWQVSDLPPSKLAREDAELRYQLGQVLDVVTETGAGLAGFGLILGQALRDAIRYQREHQAGDDWPGQVGLYRSAASAFGLPLAGAETDPAGSVLGPADMAAVRGALAGAEELLRERPASWCQCGDDHEAGPCGLQREDLDRADAYAALAARLGGAS
ncbi:MAG TPA: hypothetical protein VFX25_19115 [Streptosporangiaceae bacterium]|nr:hypothetical protein [Streptosporangiaceae bacterium]